MCEFYSRLTGDCLAWFFNHVALATGSRTITSDRAVHNNSSFFPFLKLVGMIEIIDK